MHPPITSKSRMYDLLASGAFGNTTRVFFNLDRWECSEEYRKYRLWGVRSMTPGAPCGMYTPTERVRGLVEEYARSGHASNVSVMIDAVVNVTMYMDVYDSAGGLIVYGVEYPGKGSYWRTTMRDRGVQYTPLESLILLRKHLNPSSLEDLHALRDRYPNHVYEMSACDRCFGTVPGRNAVVWEVRCDTGEYESSWGVR